MPSAMVTEQARIYIMPGREHEFEETLPRAMAHISPAPGFCELELCRGIETPSGYLLVIGWESVDDHEAFRASEGYGEWSRLLHPFFDPQRPPQVEHYKTAFHT